MVRFELMSTEDRSREQRARARAAWPVRKFSLGQEPVDDLSALTVSERVAIVWRLTQDAWASTGAAIPDYSRAQTPGKVIRSRERP